MADKEEILDVLRRAVAENKVSQREVARRSKLSQGHISRIVRERCGRLRPKTIEALEDAVRALMPAPMVEDLVVARVRALSARHPGAMYLVAEMMHLVEQLAALDHPE